MINIYNDDCLNVFKTIPDHSIDLIVTDCPYHVSATGNSILRGIFAQTGKNSEYVSSGKIFKHNEIKFKEWLPECYRVLKPGTHAYIYINSLNLKSLLIEAEKAGFIYQQHIIWDKGNAVMNRYYFNCFENIILFRKGPAKDINNLYTKNIISIPNRIGDKLHPTEKPVELNEVLIANSSQEGEVVMDPFMGAGSAGVAAKRLGRAFVGCEIDKEYFDIAEARINKTRYQSFIENREEQQLGLFD